MALVVEADQVYFFALMPLLGALDILDYVAGDLFLHCQRFITLNI